jgi:xylulokinase
LLAEVETLCANARAKAPLFLPYLSGERTPHNDPYAQGVFLGLCDSTDRATLAYSVLEGVTFALTDGLDALRADGTRETSVSLIGGGARSTFWTQLIADAFGVPIRRLPDAQCIAALGAARLGWLAADGDFSVVVSSPSVLQEFVPDDEWHSILSNRLASFRTLYQQLRPIFPTRT